MANSRKRVTSERVCSTDYDCPRLVQSMLTVFHGGGSRPEMVRTVSRCSRRVFSIDCDCLSYLRQSQSIEKMPTVHFQDGESKLEVVYRCTCLRGFPVQSDFPGQLGVNAESPGRVQRGSI